MLSNRKHIVVVGPTASGKSEVAVKIATQFSCEIISLDSMQIYKGMEIGTGVIHESERNGITHHMLSIIEPTQQHNVKDFQQAVYEILRNQPTNSYVLVGGTGLYTHAIIDGYDFAPSDNEIRKTIATRWGLDEDSYYEKNTQRAYAYLNECDPQAANKIDPNNVRRIIRALEAIEISGEEFSSTGKGIQYYEEPVLDTIMIGLYYSREILRQRISDRVVQMFEGGWIAEVNKLLPIWDDITSSATNAIGYSQIAEWNKQGSRTEYLGALTESIITRTVQFSRRQRKWFERDPRIYWINCDDLSGSEIASTALTYIHERMKNGS